MRPAQACGATDWAWPPICWTSTYRSPRSGPTGSTERPTTVAAAVLRGAIDTPARGQGHPDGKLPERLQPRRVHTTRGQRSRPGHPLVEDETVPVDRTGVSPPRLPPTRRSRHTGIPAIQMFFRHQPVAPADRTRERTPKPTGNRSVSPRNTRAEKEKDQIAMRDLFYRVRTVEGPGTPIET